MAAPIKTPITVIQEYCVRQGIVPRYDIISVQGAVHSPTFVYQLTVGDLITTGTGQNKKLSKHLAAKALLQKLKEKIIERGEEQEGGDAPGNISKLADIETAEIFCPHNEDIPGNPIGDLMEMCLLHLWAPPEFEVIHEEGPPHSKTFTVVGTVLNFKETASGKSKKGAKRQVAHSLLQQVKDIPDKKAVRLVDFGIEKQLVDELQNRDHVLEDKLGGISLGDSRRAIALDGEVRLGGSSLDSGVTKCPEVNETQKHPKIGALLKTLRAN